MKLTGTIGKCLIAGALACLCVSEAAALDVVSLKNGSTIVGQIYQKDTDGSLFMNLTDGSKRYVLVDEIADVNSNDEPFLVKAAEKSRVKTAKEYNLNLNYSVFAAYEQNFQVGKSDYNLDVVRNFKSSPGFVLGVDFLLNFSNGVCFMPSLELEFARLNKKSGNGVTSFYVNVPVQFAYRWNIGQNLSMLASTGPVIGYLMADYEDGSVLFFKQMSTTVGNENFDINTFNCQWRIGAKVIYKKLIAGVAYNIGLVDSYTNSYQNYRSASFTRHSLMISAGAFF